MCTGSFKGWTYFASENDVGANDQRKYIGMLDGTGKISSECFSDNIIALDKYHTSDWKHIAVTMSDSEMKLYVNGENAGTKALTNANKVPDLTNSTLLLGLAPWGAGEYYSGYMDEFTIYNGTLEEAQVKAVYDQEVNKGLIDSGFVTKTSVVIGVGEHDAASPVSTLPEGAEVVYQPEDEEIASVDEEGRITGLKAGVTKINAALSYAGQIYNETINVKVKSLSEELAPMNSYAFEGTLGEAEAISKGLTACSGTVEYGTGRDGAGKAVRTKDVEGTDQPGYGIRLPEKNLGQNYTVSMWINPVNEKGFYFNGPVLALGYGSNLGENWLAVAGHAPQGTALGAPTAEGKVWAHNKVLNPVNTDFPDTIFKVKQNQWTMLTISQSGQDVSFYQDGKLVGTGKADPVMDDSEGRICLGVNFWDKEFDGFIDDVSVFDTSLDDKQVAAVYLKEAEGDALAKDLSILKAGDDTGKITGDLTLPESYGGISLAWKSDAETKITSAGEVKEKDGSEVTLTVTAKDEGLGLNQEKNITVRLAKPVAIKHVDASGTEIKSELVDCRVGEEYTYSVKNKVIATDTKAYIYDEENNQVNDFKVTVSAEQDQVITVKYKETKVDSVDKSTLPETVYVIEGNEPRLPKTVKGIVSPGDGQEKTGEEDGGSGQEEGKITIDLPIQWDIPELEAGKDHTVTGKAAGFDFSIKIHVFPCDEAVEDIEAETGGRTELANAYHGIIETEYDIEITGTVSAKAGVQYYDKGAADAAASVLFDGGAFRALSGDGTGGAAAEIPNDKSVKHDNSQVYHVRIRIDTKEVSVTTSGTDTTVNKNGAYRVWITDENGNTVELTSEQNPAAFLNVSSGIIDKAGAADSGFRIINHKISWEEGYVLKKSEIYVNNVLEKLEHAKLLPAKLLGEDAKNVYAYDPAPDYTKGEEVYIIDEEKSGCYKGDAKVTDPVAEAAAGAVLVYKMYYKDGTNFPGLAAAIQKAKEALAEKTAQKIYVTSSLDTAIKAAEAVLATKGTANEASKADVSAAITALNTAVEQTALKNLEEMDKELTAHYPLKEDAKDTAKNHDAEKIGNVTFDKYKGAVLPGSAKGLTNYIKFPTDIDITEQMTFSFWTYAEGGDKENGNNVFGIGSGGEIGTAHHFSVFVDRTSGVLSASAGKTGYMGPAGVFDIPFGFKTWHLITCAVDGKKVTVYVDGEEAKTGELGASLTEIWANAPDKRSIYAGNNIYVLNGEGQYDPDYKGNVKNLRIYNALLAGQQIKDIYDYEAGLCMEDAEHDLISALPAQPGTGDHAGKYTMLIKESTIALPKTGPQGEKITWTAFDEEGKPDTTVINPGTDPAAVTLPDKETTVILKAVIKLDGKTRTVEFVCTVKKPSQEESTARAELLEALNKAKALDESAYTSASWAEFIKIRDVADKAYKEGAAEAVLKNYKTKLEAAITGTLVKRGDKTDLKALIQKAEQAIEDAEPKKADYEPSVWDGLVNAIQHAKDLSDDVDQAAVDTEKSALQEALDNFKPKKEEEIVINQEALNTLVKDAEKFMNGKEPYEYDKAVWEALVKAIEEAKGLTNATEAQIKAAYEKLNAAKEAFKPKTINKETLGTLNTEAEAAMKDKNKTDYEDAVWEALEKAIVAVKEIRDNPNATEAQIREAYKNLWNALENFKPKGQQPEIPVTGVTISKTDLSLTEGASETLTAEVVPADASNKGIIWESSDKTIAVVDNNGKVTAVKAGTAKITAASAADKTKAAVCSVTVKAKNPTPPVTPVVKVKSVTLNVKKLTLGVKEKYTLKASVKPANVKNKKVTWKSDKPKIVSVKNGKLTAKKTGKAKITVTSQADKKKKASVTVTVKKAPTKKTKVTLNKKKVTMKTKGKSKTFQIKPKVKGNFGSAAFKYTIDKKGKKAVKVDKNGKVTAKKKGKAVITVKTYNGKAKAVLRVTVK